MQLLPITDTTVDMNHWMDTYPYSSLSSSALHPIYINIDSLTPLPESIASDLPHERDRLNGVWLDYEATLRVKTAYLQRIFTHHATLGLIEQNDEFLRFQRESAYWLGSYAVFKTLAKKNGTTDWETWGEEEKRERKGWKGLSMHFSHARTVSPVMFCLRCGFGSISIGNSVQPPNAVPQSFVSLSKATSPSESIDALLTRGSSDDFSNSTHRLELHQMMSVCTGRIGSSPHTTGTPSRQTDFDGGQID